MQPNPTTPKHEGSRTSSVGSWCAVAPPGTNGLDVRWYGRHTAASQEGEIATERLAAPASRLYQLDALRGLLAIGVMTYHVLPGVPLVFGTWGVYLFFVLSGFALEHVYGSGLDIGRFVVARVA